ncbi:hypothetical protein KIN20_022420 [Parelaphostrongylus tenuis]|uniref:Uncharacterized protein n=1 Tax=Parelaphostrongylus tenuis TaxID=148309 RepID=A0AAD5MU23_PARTN|nr:hypothetical protein KIN20_022420 [Parelaphostrongylus tenuis]
MVGERVMDQNGCFYESVSLSKPINPHSYPLLVPAGPASPAVCRQPSAIIATAGRPPAVHCRMTGWLVGWPAIRPSGGLTTRSLTDRFPAPSFRCVVVRKYAEQH